eukprot:g5456.t1
MGTRSEAPNESTTPLSAHGRARLLALLQAQDEHGYSALMNAAALDDSDVSREICGILLTHASQLDCGNRQQQQQQIIYDTTTMTARTVTTKQRLINLRDGDGYSCVHWASVCNNASTVELLVNDHGADVDACGLNGETPLHRASRFCAFPTIRALLDCGASASIRNRRRKTAADVAGMLNQTNRDARSQVRALIFEKRPNMLSTVFYHDDCLQHRSHKKGHQEDPDRILSVLRLLRREDGGKIGNGDGRDKNGNGGGGADVDDDNEGDVDDSKHVASSASKTKKRKKVKKKGKKRTGTSNEWATTELRWCSEFPLATPRQALRVHTAKYLQLVERLSREAMKAGRALPFTPHVQKTLRGLSDGRVKAAQFCDTSLSPGSRQAALRAAGAVVAAVEDVLRGKCPSAFCLVRPPGHHAGPAGLEGGCVSCGFCIFNNVAIGAAHALREFAPNNLDTGTASCSRVAIIDFDVHHGNGTEGIVRDRFARRFPNQVFFSSIHLYDNEGHGRYAFYPGSGRDDDLESNVVNIALAPMWRKLEHASPMTGDPMLDGGSRTPVRVGRSHFRQVVTNRLIPALRAFCPDLVFISAGFDGAKNDVGNQKLGCAEVRQGLDLNATDYGWLTEKIMEVARICCNGRVVSCLEGGYGECPSQKSSSKKRKRESASPSKRNRESPSRLPGTFVTPTTSPAPVVKRGCVREQSEGEMAAEPDLRSLDALIGEGKIESFQGAIEREKEQLPGLDRNRLASNIVAHIKALSGVM